ncbi:hypothetical protein JOM56_007175 [Amanita muscaria]
MQNFDYCFDSFTGDLKAMREKQSDITFQDNLAVNQEESRQPISDTRNVPDVCAQLPSRSTLWPPAYGLISSPMKEGIVIHNAEPAIYDGVLESNYIQMEENTNLPTSIEGLNVPFYCVIGSRKSRQYQCGCGHVTRRKGDMRRHHETRKHAHKSYVCSCGSSFTRSDSLKRHKTKTCKRDAFRAFHVEVSQFLSSHPFF